jgi:uncharacterized protein (TIGR03435 family)
MNCFLGVILLCSTTGAMIGDDSRTFEVAAVRPSAYDGGLGMTSVTGGPGTKDPGRIIYRNISISNLITRAYGLPPYHVIGSESLLNLRFDISATFPPGTTHDEFASMLRNLLLDRLTLSARSVQKNMNVFRLVIAPGGPKLKASSGFDQRQKDQAGQNGSATMDSAGFPILPSPGFVEAHSLGPSGDQIKLTAVAQSMSSIASWLEARLDTDVIDETGLAGTYDFQMSYVPDDVSLADAAAAPNLETAVKTDLGLKLIRGKRDVTVLMIDHVDRIPKGN